MLTSDFRKDDVFGRIRKFNPRTDEMNSAVVNMLLSKLYPEVELIKSQNADMIQISTDNMLGWSRVGSIGTFSRIAVRIVEISGLGFEWPSLRTATPEQWRQAYEDYMYDHQDLWDNVSEVAERLDNPNGEISGVITEDQAKNPLLSNGVVSTLTI